MTKAKFTVEDLRLEKKDAMTIRTVQTKAVAARQQKRRGHFVRVPMAWVEQLTSTSRPTTVILALHILYEHWRAGGRPFRLANMALLQKGISRKRKYTGLRELETLGLIEVARRSRRSPIITAIVTGPAA
jgi:hypothetical protein